MFVVYNSVELVYTQQPIEGAPKFAKVPAFDGMQNAPTYSTNSTNLTFTYTFDENNVRYLNLTADADATSFICYNGTGDTCSDSYNRQTTIHREINPGQKLEPVPVGQAFQLPVSAEQYLEVDADAHSGFTTKSRNWQLNYVNITGQAP